MIDRPLLLVCTDRGTHPKWELVVLIPVKPRTDLPDRPETPATRRGYGAQGSLTSGAPGRWRQTRKTEVRIATGRNGERVEVPPCPTCGRSPRLRIEKLMLAAQALRTAEDTARDEIDISRLPRSIGN